MPKQIIPYKYLIPDRYFFKANQKSKLRTYVLRKRIKVFTHKLIKLYLLANYNKKRMYSLFRYNEMCYIIRDTKLIKILFLIIFTKNQLFIKIPSKFDFNYMTEGQEKGKYVFDLNIKTKNFFSVNEEATILSRNYFNSQYKKAYIWGLKREKKNNITSKKIDFNYFN